MKLTDYTEKQIKQFIKDGICSVQALRDREVLKQLENGETKTNVAHDNNLSRMGLWKIRRKYDPK